MLIMKRRRRVGVGMGAARPGADGHHHGEGRRGGGRASAGGAGVCGGLSVPAAGGGVGVEGTSR